MSLKDYQEDVDRFCRQFDPSYFPIFEQLTCLTEEVGEVARELNHLYGTKKKKTSEGAGNLGEELADVIFTIICIANSTGINLDDHLNKKIEHLHERDKNRFKRKEGE